MLVSNFSESMFLVFNLLRTVRGHYYEYSCAYFTGFLGVAAFLGDLGFLAVLGFLAKKENAKYPNSAKKPAK